MDRRITTADVAREAGVSRGTVSYALNGDPDGRLLPDTRARVLAAAQRLGYQPSAAARLLRGGRSHTVLMLSQASDGFATPMARLVEQLARELAEHRLSLLWQLATPGIRRPVGEVTPAVVLTAATTHDPDFAELASGFEVPVIEAFPGRDSFIAAAAHAQVAHLAGGGHRALAFVGAAEEELHRLVALRSAGVAAAAAGAGLPEPVVVAWPTGRGRRSACLARLRVRHPDVTAVCAYNDQVALEVLLAAHDAGVAVPDALAVIGADDTPAARTSWPPLTSVWADTTPWVRHTAAHIAALARGERTPVEALPQAFEIAVRDSA